MNPIAFYIFEKPIYWYGIIIAAALIVGVVLGVREGKRRGYRSEMIFDFLLIAIPLCIVCARIYYVIFKWSYYVSDPIKIFAIWEGGLAIYGAVIGGVIAAAIFLRWRRIPIGTMLDIAAPSIIIGQAIGRWGNYVNQEAHGIQIPYEMRALKFFPAGIKLTLEDGSIAWYYATFFYESMWNLLVFIALMIMRKKIKVRGGVFAWYALLYGFGRFFIEGLRTDSLYWGSIRVSQALSLILFVGGIAYLVIQSRRDLNYPAYNGFYSLEWTEEQIEEYRAHSKLYRANENAERAAKRVKDLKNAEKNKVKAAKENAKIVANKVDELLKKYAAENKIVIKAEEKANAAKEKVKKIEEQIKLEKEDEELSRIKEEKIKNAEEKAKKAKEKAKEIAEQIKLSDKIAAEKKQAKQSQKDKVEAKEDDDEN
ncbi:MAG: prolipoprotein diacylglyceryl transferase [Eubacteriales bacterium]|nr:prolipoprotein diacylglyceryl transferase [Eubacteriales bacterium]